ncbi:hypothetical protein Barb4_05115 [Bacteroidales bacterium Barb4]|nr:hypothetical protein Barb4_05115 [Bacteroidales bacterium Barb4]
MPFQGVCLALHPPTFPHVNPVLTPHSATLHVGLKSLAPSGHLHTAVLRGLSNNQHPPSRDAMHCVSTPKPPTTYYLLLTSKY